MQFAICTYTHIFLKSKLFCVPFTIDSSHYSVHKSIKVQSSIIKKRIIYEIFYILFQKVPDKMSHKSINFILIL